MPTGIIKWFSPRRHYGFIVGENGQEVFFHESEVGAEDFPLREGDRVIFNLQQTSRGNQGKAVFKIPASEPRLPAAGKSPEGEEGSTQPAAE